MKRKTNNRKQCLAILVLTMLILTLSGTGLMTTAVRTEAAQKKTGFIKKNGSWYYYDQKGKLAKGWYKTSSGHMYYFGKTMYLPDGFEKNFINGIVNFDTIKNEIVQD